VHQVDHLPRVAPGCAVSVTSNSVRAELFRADGRTDEETGMTELIAALLNSANAPKKKHESRPLKYYGTERWHKPCNIVCRNRNITVGVPRYDAMTTFRPIAGDDSLTVRLYKLSISPFPLCVLGMEGDSIMSLYQL